MKSINRRSLLYFALAVAAALALYGLSARLAAEGGGKTAAFVTDSREIFSLAYQSGKTPADVWREVNALGVAGAAVSEFTGDELAMYSSLGVRFGSAASFTAKLNADAARAVLCWSKNSPYGAQLRSYLERKLPNVGFVEASGNVYALLPGTVEEFKSSQISRRLNSAAPTARTLSSAPARARRPPAPTSQRPSTGSSTNILRLKT